MEKINNLEYKGSFLEIIKRGRKTLSRLAYLNTFKFKLLALYI